MGFFNPGLMWFALGGAVPVIIHLLHRQKYRRVPWAAMEFLLAAIKKTQRRLRIENLILLLIRILLMILLALAISRPFLNASPLQMLAETDTHHILVIDNSYSMGYKKGSKSNLDNARESADRVLDSFLSKISAQDKVTVILGSAYPETHVAYASNPKSIKDGVAGIKLSHYGSSMYQTLQIVRDTLEKSRNQDKHVYVFTDMQRCGWEGSDEIEAKRFAELLKNMSARKDTRVSLIDVSGGSKEPADNRAVIGLRVEESVVSIKRSTRILADLYNWSNVSYATVDVKFTVDGSQVGIVSTPLPPNSPMTVTFRYEFNEPGPHFVEAFVDPDQLDIDDRRYLALDVKQGIQILIVDGKPETAPDHSDADYMKLLLAQNPFNVQGPVTNEMFTGEGLERMDVVILCNVQALTQDKVERLEDFVKRGGGLFITLGDKVDRGSYNELMYKDGKGLLPAFLGDVGGTSPEIQPRIPMRIFHYDPHHPMFGKLEGEMKRGPFSLVFYQNYRLEKVDPAMVIADLDDPSNSPLFIERKFESGKVVVYTSTINEDWSDRLPGHPPFCIAIWKLLPYLASRPLSAKNLSVGEPIQMAMTSDQYSREFSVETPLEGLSTTSPEAPLPDSKWFYIYYPGKPRNKPEEGKPITNEGLKYAGPYRLIRPKGPGNEEDKTISYFACNLPPRTSAPEELLRCEGCLDRIEAEEIKRHYPDFKFEMIGDKSTKSLEPNKPPASGLWKYILYMLLTLMCVETVLAWFFGRAKQ